MKQKIYVGPSRPYGLGLMQNSIIFDVDCIPGLRQTIESHPLLNTLLVPADKYTVAKASLREKGSPLSMSYRTIQRESKADGGK